MNTYHLRKNFTAVHLGATKKTCGKIAFKTEKIHWQNTESPVVILVSIHSSFHEDVSGDMKMDALISTIRGLVKGKISILLADTAHIHTLSLKDQEKSFSECIVSAHVLAHRYRSFFENCDLIYWHSSISQDEHFASSIAQVNQLSQTDMRFRNYLFSDSQATYTEKRRQEFPDKALFMERAMADILEQCACILVLSKKGYRYQFYPGSPYASIEYVNHTLLSEETRLEWIDVFLSIERKTIVANN